VLTVAQKMVNNFGDVLLCRTL